MAKMQSNSKRISNWFIRDEFFGYLYRFKSILGPSMTDFTHNFIIIETFRFLGMKTLNLTSQFVYVIAVNSIIQFYSKDQQFSGLRMNFSLLNRISSYHSYQNFPSKCCCHWWAGDFDCDIHVTRFLFCILRSWDRKEFSFNFVHSFIDGSHVQFYEVINILSKSLNWKSTAIIFRFSRRLSIITVHCELGTHPRWYGFSQNSIMDN